MINNRLLYIIIVLWACLILQGTTFFCWFCYLENDIDQTNEMMFQYFNSKHELIDPR
jgi:hypothetical protein